MLVVTRKLDESLIISDNIEITVLEIGKDKVKIGINAKRGKGHQKRVERRASDE